jgi:hypothetical protein
MSAFGRGKTLDFVRELVVGVKLAGAGAASAGERVAIELCVQDDAAFG